MHETLLKAPVYLLHLIRISVHVRFMTLLLWHLLYTLSWCIEKDFDHADYNCDNFGESYMSTQYSVNVVCDCFALHATAKMCFAKLTCMVIIKWLFTGCLLALMNWL